MLRKSSLLGTCDLRTNKVLLGHGKALLVVPGHGIEKDPWRHQPESVGK